MVPRNVDTAPKTETEIRAYAHALMDTLFGVVDAHLKTPPPPLLYHYTSANGLLGIIESKEIFLSDVRFLNDRDELRHGRRLAQDVVRARARATDGAMREVLERLADTFDPEADKRPIKPKTYVACFCEEGNLLSQWRGYTRPGDGISIGFSTAALANEDWQRGRPQLSAVLHRVEYDEKKQRAFIHDLVTKTLDGLMGGVPQEGSEDLAGLFAFACVGALHAVLEMALPQLKNSLFAEEREWRLVHTEWQQHDMKPNFRCSDNRLVPYLKLPLHLQTGPQQGRLPIADVIHAPTADPDFSRGAILELLAAHGYPRTVTVRGSDTPLRF